MPSISVVIIVLISIVPTINMMKIDYHQNVSPAKDVAKYIDDNIEEGTTIYNEYHTKHQPIIGYLQKNKYNFYSLSHEQYETYVIWDEKWKQKRTEKELDLIFYKALENNPSIYVLSDRYFDYKCNYLLEHNYECTKILDDTSIPIIVNVFNQFEQFDFNLYKVRRIKV